jgi:membrane-associated phospholipid phosphatase
MFPFADLNAQWRLQKNDVVYSATVGVTAIGIYAYGGLPQFRYTGNWGGNYRIQNELVSELRVIPLATQALMLSTLGVVSFSKNERWPLAVMALQSFSNTYILTQLAKSTFGRERPYFVGQPIGDASYGDHRSFWSASSALSGTASGLLWAFSRHENTSPFMRKTFRGLSLASTATVMFSRVYAGQHHISDVVVGASIGFLIGYFTPRMYAIPGGMGISLGN